MSALTLGMYLVFCGLFLTGRQREPRTLFSAPNGFLQLSAPVGTLCSVEAEPVRLFPSAQGGAGWRAGGEANLNSPLTR